MLIIKNVLKQDDNIIFTGTFINWLLDAHMKTGGRQAFISASVPMLARRHPVRRQAFISVSLPMLARRHLVRRQVFISASVPMLASRHPVGRHNF